MCRLSPNRVLSRGWHPPALSLRLLLPPRLRLSRVPNAGRPHGSQGCALMPCHRYPRSAPHKATSALLQVPPREHHFRFLSSVRSSLVPESAPVVGMLLLQSLRPSSRVLAALWRWTSSRRLSRPQCPGWVAGSVSRCWDILGPAGRPALGEVMASALTESSLQVWAPEELVG